MGGGSYTLRGAASPCWVLPPERQSPAKAERPHKQAPAGPADTVELSRMVVHISHAKFTSKIK
jgi:hypothetical protein